MLMRRLCFVLLIVACSRPVDRTSPADSVAASQAVAAKAKSDSLIAAGPTTAGLAGTRWKLVKFIGMNDSTKIPTNRDKYTIAFGADGKVEVQADCNRGSGKWSSPEPSALQVSQFATTRAACPPGSLSPKFLGDFQYMRSWILRNGHLYISLMADGGIYELEPLR